jgi:hypothetical protein
MKFNQNINNTAVYSWIIEITIQQSDMSERGGSAGLKLSISPQPSYDIETSDIGMLSVDISRLG